MSLTSDVIISPPRSHRDSQVDLNFESAGDGVLVATLPSVASPVHAEERRISVLSRLDAAAKRTFDATIAVVGLLVLLPVFLLLAAAVKLDSRGPALYHCRRRGLGGRPIDVLKFRKMHDGSRGGALTLQADSRLTRVGRLLAASRLDELPQLWNVLRGDMSLVGPRPEDPLFVDIRAEDFARILTVRPGITGLSQLAYAKEREILGDEDPTQRYLHRVLPQKIALDTLYATSRTLAMDLAILVWTIVPIVLRRDVAVERGTGRLCLRRRPAS